MLATNGNCELPCWWGVIPGQSDWHSVRERFIAYGGFYFDLFFSESVRSYYLLNEFAEEDGVIQSIEVNSEFQGYGGGEAVYKQFVQDWARYSLAQVLTRYGVPSQVAVSPATMEGDYYRLYVFYHDLGIGIRYCGPVLKTEESAHICFSFEHITLWLQSPERFRPSRFVAPDEWSMAILIEDAAGMSVDEFYETFRRPGSCLEVPLASW